HSAFPRLKQNALRVLRESVLAEDTGTANLAGFDDVADLIAWRAGEANKLRNWINRKEKYPLDVSGELNNGVSGVRLLAEGIANENVLARDYTIWGEEGEKWSISMESDDFDTVVHLVYPNGSDSRSRPQVASNDDGGRHLNSQLETITLTQTGYYKVRASAYYSASTSDGTGSYQLVVENVTNR
ncbi:MAG: hypothetical protein AAGL17_06875, partial [Cyanobacteria bacterium J06576_12]